MPVPVRGEDEGVHHSPNGLCDFFLPEMSGQKVRHAADRIPDAYWRTLVEHRRESSRKFVIRAAERAANCIAVP